MPSPYASGALRGALRILAMAAIALAGVLPLQYAAAGSGRERPPLAGYYVHAADDAGATYLTDGHCALLEVLSRIKRCTDTKLVDALTNPRTMGLIDGVSLNYDWADVEPAPGRFDFSYFRNQLAALADINARTGRDYKAVLSIVPSTFPNHPAWYNPKVGPGKLPPWLFEEKGARRFKTISTGYVMINSCLPMTVPVPWDPVFQAQYDALIRAFGTYVEKEPHRDLIAAVKLIGLVYLDEISHLPSAVPTPGRLICVNRRVSGSKRIDIPNDIEQWQRIGYTRAKVLAAFKSIVEKYKEAFPDMPLELSVTPQVLPPIDNKGNLVTIGATGRPNIRSAAASSHPLIEIADAILGRNLMVSDHGFVSFKPNANLAAFYNGGGATIGFVNGWLISIDEHCIMTGGFGSPPPRGCEEPWAMAQNLTEAEISGASYMFLDLPDLMRAEYHDVLRRAHDFLIAHPGGPTRLIALKAQDLASGVWSYNNVRVSHPSLARIDPPVQRKFVRGPATGFVDETPVYGSHSLSSKFLTPKAGNYAFSVFAGLPRGTYNARWIKIAVNTGGGSVSKGVFALNGRVQESSPVPVDPAAEDRARINGGPGAAHSNTFMNDHSWNQLVVRFRARAASSVVVTIALVKPKSPVRNGGGYHDWYLGEPARGVALWAPQIFQVTGSN